MSERRLRVVFITMTFDPEPGALRGLPLAKWLAARGYDIQVVTGFPNYPIGRIYDGYATRPWKREVMDGIPVLRVPIYPSHDTNPIKRSWTYVSFMLAASTIGVALAGRADVVYLYDPPPTNGIASLVLSVLRSAPVVHHIGDLWPDNIAVSGMVRPDGTAGSTVIRLVGALCKMNYRRAKIMTVLSPGFKRILIERGVPADKIEVVHNWTDESVFKPVPRDEALAEELGFTGRFNIVYAGNVGPLQGIDNVVRAAALVRDSHPEIQVVIIGTGPLLDETKALAAKLRADNVRFIARREFWEMPRINALADALLVHLIDVPVLAATIPSKTQVALASARPVLIAVRGDAADIVREANAGPQVEPENPAALAVAMGELARTPPSELEAMGQRGREYYLSHLSLDIAGREMDRIFRQAAGM